MKKNNQNGGGKTPDIFQGKEVVYPVKFDMKSVMTFRNNDEENKLKLEKVFKLQKVVFRFVSKKMSSKGTYMSYTYNITIINQQQFEALYRALKAVEGLKFAL